MRIGVGDDLNRRSIWTPSRTPYRRYARLVRFSRPSTQLWTPVYHDKPEDTMTSFSNHMFRVVGRLKPGVSAAQGVADLSIISQRIHNAHSSTTHSYFEAPRAVRCWSTW